MMLSLRSLASAPIRGRKGEWNNTIPLNHTALEGLRACFHSPSKAGGSQGYREPLHKVPSSAETIKNSCLGSVKERIKKMQ